jgi:hypothetical protein
VEDVKAFKITGGYEVDIFLIVKRDGFRNVHKNGITENTRFGIGVPRVKDGVFHFCSTLS